MLLAKFARGDHGTEEIDRVCLGLRQTMGWIADAVEKAALSELHIHTDPEPRGLSPAEPEES